MADSYLGEVKDEVIAKGYTKRCKVPTLCNVINYYCTSSFRTVSSILINGTRYSKYSD
jgi:hypothetical protein